MIKIYIFHLANNNSRNVKIHIKFVEQRFYVSLSFN